MESMRSASSKTMIFRFSRERALEKMVENAPRVPRRVARPAGSIELRTVFHAAIHRSRSHLEIAAEEFCFAGDLKGQLTGGHETRIWQAFFAISTAPGSAG